MPTLVQINPVIRNSTSTGRIMREIGDVAMDVGWSSYVAYSLGRDGMVLSSSRHIPVGNRWDVALHGLATRLFDRHGLGSVGTTRKFVEELRRIGPDIIHIHNIHGYFLNYPILFDYLLNSDVKVVWTVHDCWLYTGHCYYYSYVGCDKWQSGCGHCPQRGAFPRSLFIDRSRRNFADKKKYFTSLPPERMVIVPVSEWIRREMSKSFFRDCRFQVIHNGIDTSVFRPYGSSDIRRRLHIEPDKKIILGLASIWSDEKGLGDFITLSSMIDPDETIVLVGIDPKTAKRLPPSIHCIRRTENVEMLARLYSEASVFVNPTWQDNYPTVNLEAIACGTPVVTYRTGGSTESVTPSTGRVVERGDVAGLLEAIHEIERKGKDFFRQLCRDYALANFSKAERYRDYIALYESLLTR